MRTGQLLFAILNYRGITQAELSEMTGLSRPDINEVFKSKRGLGEKRALVIGNALGIHPEVLLLNQSLNLLDRQKGD